MYPCISKASPTATLLPPSYCGNLAEGQKIHKRTIANLSHWPPEKIEVLRRLLKDEALVAAKDAFVIEQSFPMAQSKPFGDHPEVGLDGLLSSTRSRERDLWLP